MRRRLAYVVMAGLSLVFRVDIACASFFSPFSGFVDFSLLDSKVEGLEQDNFRQEYNLHFDRRMAKWTSLRASFRYFKFDQELEQVLGAYREEIQPSAEFRWDHPLVHFSARGLRRKVVTTGDQGIITNTFQTSLQSRNQNWPTFSLRYDSQNSFAEGGLQDKDIVNRRFLASANHKSGLHQLYYSFDHGVSENLISNLENTTNRHTFRWQGIGKPKGQGELQLSGNYQFAYRQQYSKVEGSGPVLEFVTSSEGLYAFNDTPVFGALQPRGGLVDGNTTAPVIPLIDIGGSGVGHNMGGDFVGPETLAAIYIYTDRPSGNQVVWEIYGSNDNQTWDRVSPVLSQSFNLNLNRYELEFKPTSFQFFKAVNTGFNEIAQVNITEIRFLRSVPGNGGGSDQSMLFSSHIMDGRAGMVINDSWDTALDISLNMDENHGRGGDRNRASAGWRLSCKPNAKVVHNFRVDGFRQAEDGDSDDIVETSQGYALLLRLNQVIRGSFALSNRLSWLHGNRSQEIQSGAVQGNATVIRGLAFSIGSTVSRNRDFLGDKEFRSWLVRTGAEAGLLNNLDLNVDALFQESFEMGAGLVSSRLNGGLGLNWRLTSKIFLRGTLRYNRDNSHRLTRDVLASWNILQNFRISLQHYELIDDSKTTTLRRSVNANWDLGTSSRYFARLSEVDLSGSGGTAVVSFQQGIRIGF